MILRDATLAALTSVIWGLAFVATQLGLESFSAAELTALRFLIAAAPIFLVARPKIAWSQLILIGLTLFAGQFLLLFLAFKEGMPAGLASVTQQSQAFFTVLLAAAFLREVPSLQQCIGMTVALAGLTLIALSIGVDLTPIALALALAAAFSWAVGNILVKQADEVAVFPLVIWASLVPPLPALALSAIYDRHIPILWALSGASWISIGAAVYLGTIATFIAYAIWGDLLQRYSASSVTPFALLAPCTGVLSSAVIFEEGFEPARYAGMALVFAGLAIVVLHPLAVFSRPSLRAKRSNPGSASLARPGLLRRSAPRNDDAQRG
jgi:O-acetylserine/cysteine efflux transporter